MNPTTTPTQNDVTLEEIKKRCEPLQTELWRCSRSSCRWVGTGQQKKTTQIEALVWEYQCPKCSCNSFYHVKPTHQQKADAIEIIRTDIPALVEMVERLQKQLEQSEKDCSQVIEERDEYEEWITEVAQSFDPNAEWSSACDLRTVADEGIDSLRGQVEGLREAIKKMQSASFEGCRNQCLDCGEVNELSTIALADSGEVGR